MTGEAQAKARRTYDAAADAYDSPVNSFWSRFGRRTVERLGLRPGARVLDVCCGSGASALPAAEIVGADGDVLGVDLAVNLLALARAKAERMGLRQARFREGDLMALDVADESCDAVVCVFGLFFLPDMPAAVRELWRRVRPGGMLAITTWGPRFFAPGDAFFWQAVRELRPELYRAFNPWERVDRPETLDGVLRAGGVGDAQLEPENALHPLAAPDEWWSMVQGSGYRGTLEQLSPAERERVREHNLAALRRDEVRAVEVNVLYAVARKPS